MSKTVLAVWHSGGKGKTGSIREFARTLIQQFPNASPIFPSSIIIPSQNDFRLIIKVKGKIIGIESKGDPNTKLRERLLDLADNFKCDVIICSSRTRGVTVHDVDNLHYNRGYDIIWTSTYQIEGNNNRQIANVLKGKHMLELLQSLNII